jgi:aminoglycoside phosphotransferase (APT) family kinase protein
MQMHTDQVPITEPLVRELLRRQHPQWADLPLTPVAEHGTDHLLFRLAEELVVRMPVYAGSAD